MYLAFLLSIALIPLASVLSLAFPPPISITAEEASLKVPKNLLSGHSRWIEDKLVTKTGEGEALDDVLMNHEEIDPCETVPIKNRNLFQRRQLIRILKPCHSKVQSHLPTSHLQPNPQRQAFNEFGKKNVWTRTGLDLKHELGFYWRRVQRWLKRRIRQADRAFSIWKLQRQR